MFNPYENIDWTNITQVKSVSHVHAYRQSYMNHVVSLGYEHIPVSHYQPSRPYYPLEDNNLSVPEGVISSPNSEKAQLIVDLEEPALQIHACALGSFAEGHGAKQFGAPIYYKNVFAEIISQLQYPDAGGITINHPRGLSLDHICELLDYDKDRVLGIEIFNNNTLHNYGVLDWTNLWDEVLNTGRRCFGFAVIDWPTEQFYPTYGASMLLVDSKTEHNCLLAYRHGKFYAMKKDTGLRLTNLQFSRKTLELSTNRNALFKFYTNRGLMREVTGGNASYITTGGDSYVRVEIDDPEDDDGILWTQAIMLKGDSSQIMKTAIPLLLY